MCNRIPYYILILPSAGVRALTLYSVLHKSDMFPPLDHANSPLYLTRRDRHEIKQLQSITIHASKENTEKPIAFG